jgi:nucleoside-diphosphate-sugar epimerase
MLIDQPDLLFFASGVSNSAETRASAFDREVNLLNDQPRDAHIVYFSSLAVFYEDTPYTRHKLKMEHCVHGFESYTIIRIGTITWGQNPRLLINYLRRRHAVGLPLDILDVERYIVDLAEFQHWLKLIPDWNVEMNVPGRRLSVQQIVEEFVYPPQPPYGVQTKLLAQESA